MLGGTSARPRAAALRLDRLRDDSVAVDSPQSGALPFSNISIQFPRTDR